jgi:NitT/TauT family transport system substrate-binding protein
MNAAAGACVALPGLRASRVAAQALDKVTFQTDWRAQAEHGGFYQAVATGIYRRYGIECDLRMGGPQINLSQLLLGGRVDMVMSQSLEALNYVRQNLPLLCVAAVFQKDPQVLIAHSNMGNDSFGALKGKTILVGSGGRLSYWPFLKARYGYSDDQVRPYTFSMAPFLADKSIVQQGFLTSEPYVLEQVGVHPVVLLIADAGYDNYNATISVSKKMATEKSELVQRFIDASLEGWSQYLKGGLEIEAANALIKKHNPEMTDDKIEYAIRMMNDKGIVRSGDAVKLGIGAMTDERWRRFYEAMSAVGVLPKGLDPRRAYSLAFVNKGIGAAA